MNKLMTSCNPASYNFDMDNNKKPDVDSTFKTLALIKDYKTY